MKVFILKFSIFSVILIFSVIAIFKIEQQIVQDRTNFKINPDATSIIVGHSHAQVAYNDSIISNFQNLASSGEAYFYTYQKLRQILSSNPQVENVFIEFSNNQIDEQMDKWTWEDKYLSQHYSKLISFTNLDEDFELFLNNRNGIANHFSIALRENLGKITSGDYEIDLGGFEFKEKCKVDSILQTLENGIPDSLKLNSNTSLINLQYLEKCIEVCREYEKNVILIRTPQHSFYPGYYNEEKYQKIRNERFADIEYIDLKNMKFDDSEFSDLDHLNGHGARRFSIWFNKILSPKFLKSSSKQNIIHAKINLFNHQ